MASLRIIVLLAFATLVLGCTSLGRGDPEALADGKLVLEPGDRIVISEKTGRRIDIRFVRVFEGQIYGSLSQNGLHPVVIDVDQIEAIEIEQVDGLKTTLAVVGGIVAFPLAALGAGVAVIEQLE